MTSKQYIQQALRTENVVHDLSLKNNVSSRLLHGLVGLMNEAGEVAHIIEKTQFYNQEIDLINVIEELGDIMWYLAIMSDELGITFETLWEKNLRKLRVRYPDKYTDIRAKDRNLTREREALS